MVWRWACLLDPLADGVTLQKAGSRALEHGITLHKLVEGLKSAQLQTPVALMIMSTRFWRTGWMRWGLTRLPRVSMRLSFRTSADGIWADARDVRSYWPRVCADGGANQHR